MRRSCASSRPFWVSGAFSLVILALPGVFWVNASGFELIQPSLERWGRDIERSMTGLGLYTSIAVGFTRFGTYAMAKSRKRRGVRVLTSKAEERRCVQRIPLARLGFDPKLRDVLIKLGVETIGAFLRLPASGLLERFGPDAYRLHRLASGTTWTPLRHRPEHEVFTDRIELDDAESNATRLLFIVKRLLHPLLARLAARERAVESLEITLRLENKAERTEALRPAVATLDEAQLLDLARLRLEAIHLDAGAIAMTVDAIATRATREQLSLFAQKPRRDPKAADRALARLRAEYGDLAVCHPRLSYGHLPEAKFTWVPVAHAPPARPRTIEGPPPLIRRFFERPVPLPAQRRQLRDDGWLLRGLEHGAVMQLKGPFVVSGGWWIDPIHREYHFALIRRGDLLWVYFDKKRRRWFMHGEVR